MIGFIGLGVMGEPMCRNLASKSGEEVLGHDLDPAPLARLEEHGVRAAASVQEIAERCTTVFLSLPGAPEVKSVCDRMIRSRAREAARKGTLSVMVGAAERMFARIRPLLAHMGEEITHCGAPGAGQATKLINNMVLFQNVVAIAEALTLARKAGLDARLLVETLAKGSADSFALRNHAMKAMLPGEFPEQAFPVEYALRDLGYALERAAAAGNGKKYFPVLVRTL